MGKRSWWAWAGALLVACGSPQRPEQYLSEPAPAVGTVPVIAPEPPPSAPAATPNPAATEANPGKPHAGPGKQPLGRLPPEVIQKAIRGHYAVFRKCYEAGLGRDPHLKGRVSARFVIDLDGTVSNVSNGGSDLVDSEVVSCVLRAFYEIRFPPPNGGIVTVVYPIMLEPG